MFWGHPHRNCWHTTTVGSRELHRFITILHLRFSTCKHTCFCSTWLWTYYVKWPKVTWGGHWKQLSTYQCHKSAASLLSRYSQPSQKPSLCLAGRQPPAPGEHSGRQKLWLKAENSRRTQFASKPQPSAPKITPSAAPRFWQAALLSMLPHTSTECWQEAVCRGAFLHIPVCTVPPDIVKWAKAFAVCLIHCHELFF